MTSWNPPGRPAPGHGRGRAGRRAAAPQGARPARRPRVAARGAAVGVSVRARHGDLRRNLAEMDGKAMKNLVEMMEHL